MRTFLALVVAMFAVGTAQTAFAQGCTFGTIVSVKGETWTIDSSPNRSLLRNGAVFGTSAGYLYLVANNALYVLAAPGGWYVYVGGTWEFASATVPAGCPALPPSADETEVGPYPGSGGYIVDTHGAVWTIADASGIGSVLRNGIRAGCTEVCAARAIALPPTHPWAMKYCSSSIYIQKDGVYSEYDTATNLFTVVPSAPCAGAPPPPPPPPPPPAPPPQLPEGGRGRDRNAPVRVLTQRPYRGIFGGGVGETTQSLSLGLNMGGGYDSSVFVDQPADPAAVEPLTRSGSGFAQGSANLSYSLDRPTFGLTAGTGASVAYYAVLDETAPRYFGNVGGRWRMSTRANLSGNYSVDYGPLQSLSSLPGGDPSLGPTNPFGNTIGGRAESYRVESTGISFGYQLSNRIGTSAAYNVSRLRSPDRDRDWSSAGASARLSMVLTKTLGFYVGYGLSSGEYGNPDESTDDSRQDYQAHSADFGLLFAKALSLTRKTTASFGAGTMGVSDGNTTQYAVTGNASLTREIARTWSATVAFDRDVRFAEAFRQPVFSDRVSSSVGGLITRRVGADAGMSWSFGKVGFEEANNRYRNLSSAAGIRLALSRFLSGSVRYTYARYWFDGGVDVPVDLLFQTGRHGINAYLSAWLPLFSTRAR